MSFLQNTWYAWKNHGTKVLGFAQGTVAAVASVNGIIPDHQLKYYMASLGLLTFYRGFFNSKQTPSDSP